MAKIKTSLKHIRIPGVGHIPEGEWVVLPVGKEHIAEELHGLPGWEVELTSATEKGHAPLDETAPKKEVKKK